MAFLLTILAALVSRQRVTLMHLSRKTCKFACVVSRQLLLWFLIVGVNAERWNEQASAAGASDHGS